MKKAIFSLMCLVAMLASGTSLNAQEISITLWPGWNWISYPNAKVMDVASALGVFVPMDGDKIKSQNNTSSYLNGQWRGGVTQFMPGRGYMYYSARTETTSFVFAEDSLCSVTTATPTDITATCAVVGGSVTVPEGCHVFLRGVCWDTEQNPDIDDGHTTEDTGIGSFSGTLEGLNPNTIYYVRAYAVSDYGLAYGNVVSFTTEQLPSYTVSVSCSPIDGGTAEGGGIYQEGQTCTVTATANAGYIFTNWTENGGVVSTNANYSFTVNGNRTLVANYAVSGGGDYEYVDLGLPSGLLWATCNVGADTPEDYGDYFAWGETQPKNTYNWSTYQYCNGSINTLTKYCNNSGYGYNGFTDNLTTLLPEDDAATANWGSDWRMPTEAEWQELLDNTTCTWTTQNGVDGSLFTASNGNNLFLPAAGCRYGSSLYYADSYGGYWSSSLNTVSSDDAWGFYFYSGSYLMGYNTRYYGQSVRAVRSGLKN